MDRWSPKTGQTAQLCVGTMNFGKRTDAAESARIIARAIERDLTFFDTANAYNEGESERILGKALKSKRDSCVVATKVGFGRVSGKQEGLSRERILSAIDQSLSRLGTEYVDLYYLHVPDYTVPLEESLDALQTLLENGKIKRWGVSNYASWQVLEMNNIADARKMPRPVMAQQIYNVLVRQLDIEWFKFTKRFPIHTTIYNPLAGGLLTGKHTRQAAEKGSRFDNNPFYQRRYFNEAMLARVDQLTVVAKSENMTLTELAYAWVAHRPGVDSILVGPASVAHLDAAIDAVAKTLSDAAVKQLDVLHTDFQGTDASYAR